MAHGKTNNSKSRKQKGKKDEKVSPQKANRQNYDENTTNKSARTGILISLAVVLLAYVWRVYSNRVEQTSTPLGRLMHYWPPGDAIAIQGTGDDRQVVATHFINKGSVIVSAEEVDLEQELLQEHGPELKTVVEQILPQVIRDLGASLTTLTSSTKILVMIRLLELIDLHKEERWTAYAESLPKNVTTVNWYWTEEERNCMVPRRTSAINVQDLRVFHGVMELLAVQSPLVQQLYSTNNATLRSRAEWVLLMMKTRGFGNLYFLPMLDMINHHALKAISPFRSINGREYLVASQDIEAGQQVYNNYGELSPLHSLEVYGFVPSRDEAAYFESPSIQEDLWQSPRTKGHIECTKDQGARFFGNVGYSQIVEAEYEKLKLATTFKAYMPTRTAPACMKAMLQSQNDTDLAQYVASKLQDDYDRYDAMVNKEECQSNEGNFPHIRQANQVTAWLLKHAQQVAEEAANDASIPYPRKA